MTLEQCDLDAQVHADLFEYVEFVRDVDGEEPKVGGIVSAALERLLSFALMVEVVARDIAGSFAFTGHIGSANSMQQETCFTHEGMLFGTGLKLLCDTDNFCGGNRRSRGRL